MTNLDTGAKMNILGENLKLGNLATFSLLQRSTTFYSESTDFLYVLATTTQDMSLLRDYSYLVFFNSSNDSCLRRSILRMQLMYM